MVTKICTKCGEEKQLGDFYKQKSGKLGRKSSCKACTKELDKAYRASNKEKIQAYLHETRDNRIKVQSEWRSVNRDYQVIYRESNRGREIRRLADQRRLARKLRLPDTLTEGELSQILSHFNGECALSGSKEDLQYDHLIPLSSGTGGTVLGNIIPLRADLNQSKGNRNIFEWFEDNEERFSLCRSRFDAMIEYIANTNGMSTDEYLIYYERAFNASSVISRTKSGVHR